MKNFILKEHTFEEFVFQYEKLISKLTKKFNVANYTKDDIKQEILNVMWRVYKYFDESKNVTLTHYLIKSINYRMALLINENSKKHSMVDHSFYSIDQLNQFKSEENLEKNLKKQHLEKKLWQFVDNLNYGKTARYYYIGQMTAIRIAEVEKISFQGVHDRLNRVRKKIYEHFGDEIRQLIS